MERPNILFLQVDQLAAQWLGAYGDPVCVAPALDGLAEAGVVFETAYCNFPLCAPSRVSMASGQLASAVAAYDNAAEFAAEIPTYAHYLRETGYQTCLSGKMHFIGPDQFHGFEKRLTADLYPADYAWVPRWGDEGERDTNDARAVLTSGVCERSVQIDFDEEVAHRAIRHLYDLARTKDKRPFFLQVSFTHPHDPYLCRRREWDLYDGRDIPLPTVGALSEAEHDAHSVRLLKDFGMLDAGFADDDIRRARRAYYGSISYVDGLIGRILETLRATGADRNTAIVFTSDHGEMLGERGLWFKKHFFEPASRVPLIVNAPWIAPGRAQEFASLVDLLPTFMGLAGGAPWGGGDEPLEGIDLTGALQRPAAERAIYGEYLAEATTAPIFMIRRGRWKFITSDEDPDLLFDLEADPLERENLAGRAAHGARLAAFRDEARAKWDASELAARIRLSQARRARVMRAMGQGAPCRWNHGEAPGEETPWYRGEQGYNEWAFDHLPARG